ncbi:MAG: DMT family transporter [Tahibacter sp.]
MQDGSEGNARGILSMLGAVLAFALMDAGLKVLSPHYPPMQVAAMRGLSSLPLILVWVAVAGGPRQLLRVRWGLHLLRGVLSVVMLASFSYALRLLPLAEAYSLFFVAPLLVTALAVPLLGERVGWRRWLAILVGLAGTVVVLRPQVGGVLSLGGIAVLISASSYAISAITVRVLGRTDSTLSMVFWMLFMLSGFATLAAWRDWVAIRPEHWQVLAGLAVSGALGQYGVTEAFRRSPASVIAPLEYTALLWGICLDWYLWNTAPDRIVLLGSGIIILSGLYLLRRGKAHSPAEHP